MSGLVRRVAAALALVTGVAAVTLAVREMPAGAFVSRVDAAGFRFDPARVEIEVRDSVIWEAGDDGHTVTARDGSFDSGTRGVMREGDQYRWRFGAPGTYQYFCRVHQNRGMQGEIVVLDPGAATTTTAAPAVTPVTAAAPTPASADPGTTVSTAPTTTTSRVLATSSSTSPAMATSTTAPVGTAILPQAPPVMNPETPLVGSAEADANLPRAEAAARRAAAEDDMVPAFAGAIVVLLALFGGVMGVRARRRRAS